MLTGEQSVPYIPIPEDRGLRHYMIILDRTPGLVREPPCQFFMVSFRIVFLDGFFLFCSKFLHWQHSLHLIDQSITAVYFSHRKTGMDVVTSWQTTVMSFLPVGFSAVMVQVLPSLLTSRDAAS